MFGGQKKKKKRRKNNNKTAWDHFHHHYHHHHDSHLLRPTAAASVVATTSTSSGHTKGRTLLNHHLFSFGLSKIKVLAAAFRTESTAIFCATSWTSTATSTATCCPTWTTTMTLTAKKKRKTGTDDRQPLFVGLRQPLWSDLSWGCKRHRSSTKTPTSTTPWCRQQLLLQIKMRHNLWWRGRGKEGPTTTATSATTTATVTSAATGAIIWPLTTAKRRKKTTTTNCSLFSRSRRTGFPPFRCRLYHRRPPENHRKRTRSTKSTISTWL